MKIREKNAKEERMMAQVQVLLRKEQSLKGTVSDLQETLKGHAGHGEARALKLLQEGKEDAMALVKVRMRSFAAGRRLSATSWKSCRSNSVSREKRRRGCGARGKTWRNIKLNWRARRRKS